MSDLNRRPHDYESGALPTELIQHMKLCCGRAISYKSGALPAALIQRYSVSPGQRGLPVNARCIIAYFFQSVNRKSRGSPPFSRFRFFRPRPARWRQEMQPAMTAMRRGCILQFVFLHDLIHFLFCHFGKFSPFSRNFDLVFPERVLKIGAIRLFPGALFFFSYPILIYITKCSALVYSELFTFSTVFSTFNFPFYCSVFMDIRKKL
jgi:hypothetical protein